MSEHQSFLKEKNAIDTFISQGYWISGIREDLSGAWLELESAGSGEKETLHLQTADARKYMSGLLIKQQSL